jgi:Concanavalin A-like lectin/glucanases superfamily
MALKDNLIAYYSMEGNSNDVTGSGYNGTDHTISYSTSYGIIKQGASFNGSSSYIDAGSSIPTSGLSQLTCSIWIKFNSIGSSNTQQVFVSKYDNVGGACWLLGYLNYPGSLGVGFRAAVCSTTSSTDYGVETSLAPTTGTWYHVVMVFDGTQIGNANRLKMYVNNVQYTLTFTGTIPSVTTTSTAKLGIGNDIYTAGNFGFTNGYIDEVGIWSRALSVAEINSLYNSGVGKTYPFSNNMFFKLLK